MSRVIWIIIDSVGIGELPDADKFGDVGANTIGNIVKSQGVRRTSDKNWRCNCIYFC